LKRRESVDSSGTHCYSTLLFNALAKVENKESSSGEFVSPKTSPVTSPRTSPRTSSESFKIHIIDIHDGERKRLKPAELISDIKKFEKRIKELVDQFDAQRRGPYSSLNWYIFVYYEKNDPYSKFQKLAENILCMKKIELKFVCHSTFKEDYFFTFSETFESKWPYPSLIWKDNSKRIYLGSKPREKNTQVLENLKIKNELCCDATHLNFQTPKNGLQPSICNKLDKAVKEGPLLIYETTKSRKTSGLALIIAYLMKKRINSFEKIYKKIQKTTFHKLEGRHVTDFEKLDEKQQRKSPSSKLRKSPRSNSRSPKASQKHSVTSDDSVEARRYHSNPNETRKPLLDRNDGKEAKKTLLDFNLKAVPVSGLPKSEAITSSDLQSEPENVEENNLLLSKADRTVSVKASRILSEDNPTKFKPGQTINVPKDVTKENQIQGDAKETDSSGLKKTKETGMRPQANTISEETVRRSSNLEKNINSILRLLKEIESKTSILQILFLVVVIYLLVGQLFSTDPSENVIDEAFV